MLKRDLRGIDPKRFVPRLPTEAQQFFVGRLHVHLEHDRVDFDRPAGLQLHLADDQAELLCVVDAGKSLAADQMHFRVVTLVLSMKDHSRLAVGLFVADVDALEFVETADR